jgi:hypothetical protein
MLARNVFLLAFVLAGIPGAFPQAPAPTEKSSYQQAMQHPRMEHVLWVIQHQPQSRLAGSPVASVVPRWDAINTRGDYEMAHRLWLAQAAAYPDNPDVLRNAATFFRAEEPVRAEVLFKRALQLDPQNKMRVADLARFYALIIARCDPPTSNYCPDSGWLNRVKSELESSSSVHLVGTLAQHLRRTMWNGAPVAPEFAARLLSRARELQPGNPLWRQTLQ